jgi:hypothetical protein
MINVQTQARESLKISVIHQHEKHGKKNKLIGKHGRYNNNKSGKTVREAAMNLNATTGKPLFLGVFQAYHSTAVIFVFLPMVEVEAKIAVTQLLPIFRRVYGSTGIYLTNSSLTSRETTQKE